MANLRSASVFLSATKAIVSAQHYNAAGIYYEQPSPVVVAEWRGSEVLGAALRLSLKQFSLRDENLRNRKQSDWPSYIASKCRSIRDFERTYRRVWVIALNSSELFYDASTTPDGEQNLKLHVTLNPYATDDVFAEPLDRLFEVCSKWDLMLD
jgi:hypothetical protein